MGTTIKDVAAAIYPIDLDYGYHAHLKNRSIGLAISKDRDCFVLSWSHLDENEEWTDESRAITPEAMRAVVDMYMKLTGEPKPLKKVSDTEELLSRLANLDLYGVELKEYDQDDPILVLNDMIRMARDIQKGE